MISKQFDIDEIKGTNRVSKWKDLLNEEYYPLDLASISNDFNFGKLSIIDTPSVRYGAVTCDPIRVNRRRNHLALSENDFYFIPIPLKAPLSLSQRGKEASIAPGEFSVISTNEPYCYIQNTKNTHLTLRIKGEVARNRIPFLDDFAATKFTSKNPIVSVFTKFVGSIISKKAMLDPRAAEQLVPHLMDLLALAMQDGFKSNCHDESIVRLSHLRRIFQSIEDEISNEALSIGVISKKLGISKRYIQKLFSSRACTLSETIRERRIAMAKRWLSDPSRNSLSIATVGFSVGFSDPAHFSRTFKESVGMSPKVYKETCNLSFKK